MTTPKATFAGLALIAALCAGFTLGLTVPAWAGFDEGLAAWMRRDYASAIHELRPLAEQGNAKAQYMIGDMYSRGLGVPQDYAKALHWHRKAAEKGYARAQFALGTMYGLGRGVTQDYLQAHVWFNIAVSNLPPGKVRDAAVESRDDVVAKRMTPAQISEAQKLAREWKPKK